MATATVTPEQFAQKVKAKYPQYKDVPDAELTQRIVAKYPQYKTQIAAAPPIPPPPGTPGIQRPDPGMAKVPLVSGHEVAQGALQALPAVGATVGGVLGAGAGAAAGGVGAGPGAFYGASLGGGAGKAAEQLGERFLTKEGAPQTSGEAAKAIGVEGAIQGVTEVVGGKLVPMAVKGAARALPEQAAKTMSRILGFKTAKKVAERVGAEEAVQIGKIVNEHVGPTGSLESLASKVSGVKESFNDVVAKAVTASGAKLTNLHSLIDDAALRASRELELMGGGESAARAILKRADELRALYPEFANPEQVLQFKRLINSAESGLPEQFTSKVGVASNAAISKALPTNEARAFVNANAKITKLIEAEKAINVKLAEKAGIAGAISKAAKEHPTAILTAAAASGLESTAVRTTGIAAKKALGKAAARVAPYAKYSGAAARVAKTIHDIAGGGSISKTP